MRISADYGVWICLLNPVALLGENHLRQVFQIYLVHYARIGRHDLEIVERLLSPFEKTVTLAVALELQLGVEIQRTAGSMTVHLHRVIDDQFHGLQGIDTLGIAAQCLHRLAHRGEIDHRGNAGEILQQHSRRPKRYLHVGLGFGVPVDQRLDIVARDAAAVLVAQQVFEQYFQCERQALGPIQFSQAIDFVVTAARRQRCACIEAVSHIRISCSVTN